MTQPDTAEHGAAETPDLAKSVFALRVRSAAGGLDVQAVQGILGLASQAFGDCDELVARDARASIHFRVSRRGVATRTRSTGASEAARRCFARALSRVVFPEAKRPTNVVLELSRRRRVPTIIHHPPVARSTQQVRALYARGQRSSLSLERILRMYRPRFAPCYEQILHSRPGFTADVPVRFAVKPDGSIHNLVIQSNHYALRSCMATFMRTLRFSPMPHQADTTVSFILEFRPPPKRINGKRP